MDLDLDEARLRRVPDGEVLHTLPNGIEIVRRRKHEPIRGMEKLTAAEIERKTEKENGSKFLPGTTLANIVEMTTETLGGKAATSGRHARYNRVFDRPIGISRGVRVCGLRVVRSGRTAHGYPVDEATI